MESFLDFEKPIAELESKIRELRRLAESGDADIGDEVIRLEAKASTLLIETYANLTPWQKTQVARHPNRPHFSDYVTGLIEGFTPLAGDRAYGDDPAIRGGLGRFRGRPVMVIGHEKGSGTDGRVRHNFGMAQPEGYRKAVRLMKLANRFNIAIITFVDTPGAYPGIGAEERGAIRSHRPLHRGLSFTECSAYFSGDRRRRIRWRDSARDRQPRHDAGACDLFGDIA